MRNLEKIWPLKDDRPEYHTINGILTLFPTIVWKLFEQTKYHHVNDVNVPASNKTTTSSEPRASDERMTTSLPISVVLRDRELMTKVNDKIKSEFKNNHIY